MKLRLTYLLLLGLVFSGAFAFTVAPAHKDVSIGSPSQSIFSNKQVLFACNQNIDQSSISFEWMNDTDDDDDSDTGKKISPNDLRTSYHNFYEFHFSQYSFQTGLLHAAVEHSASTQRYLLLRVIRV